VRLAAGFDGCDDAKDGPLKQGEFGTLRKDDGSGKPFQVEASGGRTWWYREDALERAD
jgi:hypothetical protein